MPRRFRSDLWRGVAESQDAAVAHDQSLRAVERAVAVRLGAGSAPGGGHAGRRLAKWRVAVGAVVLASAVAAVLVYRGSLIHHATAPTQTSLAASPSLSPASAEMAGSFVAEARSDLPLRFTDGSTVIFRAGSAGRMRHLGTAGADVVLERGWLEAHVVHAATTLWLVHAGPYRVRVTGTRFAVIWAAATFELDLYEGAVVIDGAVLGAGVPLRAGQRLKIASGVVLIEPLGGRPPIAAVAAAGPVSPPGGEVAPGAAASVGAGRAARPQTLQPQGASISRLARPVADGEWLALAERGEYREARAAAQQLGWAELCQRLDARRLLTLGDVARYSGAHAEAQQAFQALVRRFPNDHLAADAVFSLGRLAFESGHPRDASRWFRRYVAEWPNATLADQAAGRLLECAIRLGDREAARSAARRYLARAPGGPHATLARDVLEPPADGRP